MSRRGGDRGPPPGDVVYEEHDEVYQRGPRNGPPPPPPPGFIPPRPEQLPRRVPPPRERDMDEEVFIRRTESDGDRPPPRDRSRAPDRREPRGREVVEEEFYERRGPPPPGPPLRDRSRGPPPRRPMDDDDDDMISRAPSRQQREIIEEERYARRMGPDRRGGEREVVEDERIRRGPPPRPPPSAYDREPPPMFNRGPPPTQLRESRTVIRDQSPPGSDARGPAFLRDDYGRNENQNSLVLRERQTFRERSPSSSPSRYTERVYERRSGSRSRTPPPVLRRRVIETSEFRRRERTPSPVRFRETIIERERERERAPTPPPAPPMETIRYREREERFSSPSSEPSRSPSPPPQPYATLPPTYAPPIHQEIITHHRHIDHGFERPEPPPAPPTPEAPRKREKMTEIDIYNSRNHTEVDIKKTERNASPARSAKSVKSSKSRKPDFYDDQDLWEDERDRTRYRSERMEITRRRSESARPRTGDTNRFSVDIRERVRDSGSDRIRDDESESGYYSRKTDERAYAGEAYNGATKDWAILDVPPGTERVQMDGIGGASQEVTWQRYNGVRRSKFLPSRERKEESRPPSRQRERESTGMEIDIRTSRKEKEDGGTKYWEREVEITKESDDRRVGFPLPPRTPPKQKDLWTEITKDLVLREALDYLGYDYEETEFFFYVIQYLKYEDVQELVELSEQIRRDRRRRLKDIGSERDRLRRRDEHEKKEKKKGGGKAKDKDKNKDKDKDSGYDDERIFEREYIYDSRGPPPRRSDRW